MQDKDRVFMNRYAIIQKTGGPLEETMESKILVEFNMLSRDTHSLKHERFLNDLRVFMESWSSGAT